MKIQGDRPDDLAESLAAHSTERPRRAWSEPSHASITTRLSDRIDVSPDARLWTNAVRAATEAPDIRPAVVERGRALLASGALGRDVVQLADRMIDHMLRA